MNVFYPYPPSEEVLSSLQVEAGPSVKISKDLDEVSNFQVLIEGRITTAHLQLSRSLRHVIVPFAGVPEKTLALLERAPEINLYNLHHNAEDTAELAVALLLSAAKCIVPLDRKLRCGDWSPRYEPSESIHLAGKTAVIVGYGSIGSHVGAVCRAIGMDVIGITRGDKPGTYPVNQLDSLLPKADAIILAVPLTADTTGLISEERLRMLPPDAILVNIARAEVVDEQALFEALRSGRLHSAGLDVWYQYPAAASGVPSYYSMPDSARSTFPSRFPFHELDNVVMSPHRAGVTKDTESRRVRDLARILAAISMGQDPPNRVSIENGY